MSQSHVCGMTRYSALRVDAAPTAWEQAATDAGGSSLMRVAAAPMMGVAEAEVVVVLMGRP